MKQRSNGIRPGTILRRVVLRDVVGSRVRGANVILDVGGREGSLVQSVLTDPAARIFLLDRELDSLSTLGPRIKSIVGDARQLPFKSQSVDLLTCLDVIEHIVEDGDALAEFARVLKSGALLILSTPKEGFRLPFCRRSRTDRAWGHVRNGYSDEELESALRNAGFAIIERLRYFNYFSRLAYSVMFMWKLYRILGRRAESVFESICRYDRLRCGHAEHCVVAVRP